MCLSRCTCTFFFLWRNSPTRAKATLFLRFLDHTHVITVQHLSHFVSELPKLHTIFYPSDDDDDGGDDDDDDDGDITAFGS